MSDLFILDDNDISPEYRREVEKMRRKVSQRDVVVYQELRKRLLKKEEPPAAKAAEIIRIDNKAVISDTKLTPVQRKMLQLTELAIQGRARHLAQRAGWSTADLGNPKKTGSPDWLRFNIAAMDDLGLTDSLVIIFHTEVEIYNVITKTVGLPFIDCLTNIVGLVANSVTSPVLSTFQQILGSVANDQGVTDSAKKLLNDVFESAEQEDKNHLFDLAPAWLMGNEEMLATVYAVSASDIKDSDWKTFLLSIVGKGNTFYSAAIGIKFADELWELLGWEKLLVDVITKKDRNYEKKLGSSEILKSPDIRV
ncbi:hypothetical protein B0G81_7838 [Paraburkholderia sp. BL6665CI2N2]|uniref:hypothetical protein n=1 Tax=Paraburkholderia sp. BL6665CI2N2 TaxID=1938806 RepID=UPI00106494A4|nr:hypothetical protein [Paraburkholderia sp. BL6665CI2N2]TDY16737.1 hypothetical protein B0G81_7838 [Paraburkholderia sp. BL6665CI2N2]